MAEEDRVCCGLLHVKTATWIIAVIQAIFAIIAIVNGVQYLTEDKQDDKARYSQYLTFGVMLVWLIFILLLMYALYKNSANLMIPHLIVTVIVFVLMIISGVMLILSGPGLKNGIILILEMLFALFLLLIEWRCYKYLKAVGYV